MQTPPSSPADFPPTLLRLANHIGATSPQELRRLAARFMVTAGFTVPDLQRLLQHALSDRADNDTLVRTVGWVFRFPPSPAADGSELITQLQLRQVIARVSDQGTRLREVDFPHPASGAPVTVTPKLLYQRKNIDNPPPSFSPYSVAFDHTQPRYVVDPAIPLNELEHYADWVELSFINRSELENLLFLLETNAIQYNDVFFSGAKIRYATLHNPKFRIEQESLTNRNTGELIGSDAMNFPFTLKGEPYVGVPDQDFAWVRSIFQPGSTPPPVDLNELREDEPAEPRNLETTLSINDVQADEAGTDFQAQGSAFLVPCPPVWDYPGDVGVAFRTAFPDASYASAAAVQSAYYEAIIDPTQDVSTTATTIPSVTRKSVTAPDAITDNSFAARLQRFIHATLALIGIY